jgi:4-azaleucine resistance transporter AzlC
MMATDNETRDPMQAFSRAGVLEAARQSVPLAVSVGAYGLVFGVLARQAGLSLAEAALMSGTVCAGTAQFVVLSLWVHPLPVATIVLTTLVVNLRFLLMGASLRPWLARLSALRAYGSACVLGDESWALTTRACEAGARNEAFLLGSGLTISLTWLGATIAGHTLGGLLRDPVQLGLDFASTAVFAALLVGLWKGTADVLPWATAAAVALVVAQVVPGTWYIPAGGVAGSVMGVVRHAR